MDEDDEEGYQLLSKTFEKTRIARKERKLEIMMNMSSRNASKATRALQQIVGEFDPAFYMTTHQLESEEKFKSRNLSKAEEEICEYYSKKQEVLASNRRGNSPLTIKKRRRIVCESESESELESLCEE
jgi:hypothetical protein